MLICPNPGRCPPDALWRHLYLVSFSTWRYVVGRKVFHLSDSAPQKISTAEFVALIAMMFSVVAFSIDSFLPAIPEIENDLQAPGRAPELMSMFMVGLAFGTLFAGPISDSIGRKPTMYLGVGLFIGAGAVAWMSQSFETILMARLLQGVGGAGPRIVSMAIVRDLYAGRRMAQIISLAMVLFAVVPTLAPLMGLLLSTVFGWRAILLALIIFMAICALWLGLRVRESLPRKARRPFRSGELLRSALEVWDHPVVRRAILAQSIALALIFCLIVTVQQIYDQVYGHAHDFAYWFGGIALLAAGSTSLLNARMVMYMGMQRMIMIGLLGQAGSAGVAALAIWLAPFDTFMVFVAWQFAVIFLTGLTVGNLNALALEPMGHISGFAASIVGFVATLLAALASWVAVAIFDGTPLPVILMSMVLGSIGAWLICDIQRARPAST